MKNLKSVSPINSSAILIFGVLLFTAFVLPADESSDWPQWRGPQNNGVVKSGEPVLEWSEEKNIKWKVEVPGAGTSTPIIWGDRIFLLAAKGTGEKKKPVPSAESEDGNGGDRPRSRRPDEGRPRFGQGDGPLPDFLKEFDKDKDGKLSEEEREAFRAQRGGRGGRGEGRRGGRGGRRGGGFGSRAPDEEQEFVLLCLDRKTGKTLWSKTAKKELPHEGHHRDHGFASASPVTDGNHIYAYFGSRGLYCFDMEGNRKWEKDFGDMKISNGFGEGASPSIHGDVIVVKWDHEGDSFILALNKTNGDELWRKSRDERTSWSTPVVLEHDGKALVIASASNKVAAYDLKTGDIVWETEEGLTRNVIPSPVSGDGLVYAMSGFRGSHLYAIEMGKTGKLSAGKGIAWSHGEGTPYVPSPLLYKKRLYFFQGNEAILSCLDAATGKPVYARERIEGIRGVYASPVGANNHIYLLGRRGNCVVIKSGDKLEVVATNTLDDRFDASPAVVGNDLYLRGHKHLYCVGKAE